MSACTIKSVNFTELPVHQIGGSPILNLLRESELSVSEMAKQMEVSLANASQHLSVLRDKGVVTTRREGVRVYYQVSNPKIIQACDLMREVLFEQLTRSGELAQRE